MKKVAICVILNVIILGFLALTTDFMCYKIQVKQDYSGWAIYTKFSDAYTFSPIKNFINKYNEFYENKKTNNWFRPDEIKKNKKKEIVLFGCSFTYGVGLKENETFSRKLSKYTNRSVYNRGIPGCGTNHMLYMVEKGLSSNIKNPEYFIYIYIAGHIYRLYMPASFFHNLLIYYKEKDNKLVLQKDWDNWHWHSYTLRTLNEQLEYAGKIHSHDKKIQFLLKHLNRTQEEINKKYPESKFVVLAYSGEEDIKAIEKELTENKIKIIYLSDLSSEDFTKKPYALEDGHPSALAWDIIIPELTKKLSL